MISIENKHIIIFSHVNPDGDAVGSSLGLYHVLLAVAKSVHIIIPNDIPEFLIWMPHAKDIIIYNKQTEQANELLEQADLLYYLDFNHADRLDRAEEKVNSLNKPTILIDHHPSPDIQANIMVSDTSASSTAELVYEYLKNNHLVQYINESSAECLFAGIMSDTGCFNYNSSQPKTYKVVTQLLAYGIDKDLIYARIYDNFSADRMQLLGYSLFQKLEVLPELQTAIIALSIDELHRFNFQTGDTEGFVNYPLSIKGIVCSVLLIEKKDHVKLSFRSKGNLSVNRIATKYFNGGGHINAAGGIAYSTLNETVSTLKEVLRELQ